MTSRPKRPRDPAQLAELIVDIAAGETLDRPPTPEEQGTRRAYDRKQGLGEGRSES